MIKALYRKWRPLTFDDVYGQNHITETLKTQVLKDRVSHAYIFTGSRGTGKTSCAKILARAVNCLSPENGNPCNKCKSCLGILDGSVMDVVEIDAASNNGVDNVRALRDEAVYTPSTVRMRVYIIDEVHMLSNQAFNALLKILEEPPAHLLFILATTELHKVLPTISSRCQRFAFKRLSAPDIERRLDFVAKQENLSVPPDALALLARISDGSMRDALSMLDQCTMVSDEVTEESVRDILGLVGGGESLELVSFIAKYNMKSALIKAGELYINGRELASLLDELALIMRDLLVLKTAPDSGINLLNSAFDSTQLISIAEEFTAQRLISGVSLIGETLKTMQRGGDRLTAELCIIRLCSEEAQQTSHRQSDDSVSHRTALQAKPAFAAKPAESAVTSVVTAKSAESAVKSASAETSPEIKAPKKAALQAESSVSWRDIVANVRDKINIAEFMSLSNPALASAQYKNGTLTVILENDFTKTMLNKPSVLDALKTSASEVYGVAVNIHLTLSSGMENPGESQKKSDKLDELIEFGKEFDNIIIK